MRHSQTQPKHAPTVATCVPYVLSLLQSTPTIFKVVFEPLKYCIAYFMYFFNILLCFYAYCDVIVEVLWFIPLCANPWGMKSLGIYLMRWNKDENKYPAIRLGGSCSILVYLSRNGLVLTLKLYVCMCLFVMMFMLK
jgi:hypothetical protein